MSDKDNALVIRNIADKSLFPDWLRWLSKQKQFHKTDQQKFCEIADALEQAQAEIANLGREHGLTIKLAKKRHMRIEQLEAELSET